jgi:hypothetical protein
MRNAAAAAQAAPAATAPNARPGDTCAGSDALRRSRTATIDPRIAAPASQRYRTSSPVLTARMTPKATGSAATSTAVTNNSRCLRDKRYCSLSKKIPYPTPASSVLRAD